MDSPFYYRSFIRHIYDNPLRIRSLNKLCILIDSFVLLINILINYIKIIFYNTASTDVYNPQRKISRMEKETFVGRS